MGSQASSLNNSAATEYDDEPRFRSGAARILANAKNNQKSILNAAIEAGDLKAVQENFSRPDFILETSDFPPLLVKAFQVLHNAEQNPEAAVIGLQTNVGLDVGLKVIGANAIINFLIQEKNVSLKAALINAFENFHYDVILMMFKRILTDNKINVASIQLNELQAFLSTLAGDCKNSRYTLLIKQMLMNEIRLAYGLNEANIPREIISHLMDGPEVVAFVDVKPNPGDKVSASVKTAIENLYNIAKDNLAFARRTVISKVSTESIFAIRELVSVVMEFDGSKNISKSSVIAAANDNATTAPAANPAPVTTAAKPQ